jgi:hypothetical protein
MVCNVTHNKRLHISRHLGLFSKYGFTQTRTACVTRCIQQKELVSPEESLGTILRTAQMSSDNFSFYIRREKQVQFSKHCVF